MVLETFARNYRECHGAVLLYFEHIGQSYGHLNPCRVKKGLIYSRGLERQKMTYNPFASGRKMFPSILIITFCPQALFGNFPFDMLSTVSPTKTSII